MTKDDLNRITYRANCAMRDLDAFFEGTENVDGDIKRQIINAQETMYKICQLANNKAKSTI